MYLSMPLDSSPRHWAGAPIVYGRSRRCGNSPENVSFHHSSFCENRGGRSWASLTVSATGDPSASRRSPCILLASSAEVQRCGAEAAGVADAMIEAGNARPRAIE
jgi:hypothetical protein